MIADIVIVDFNIKNSDTKKPYIDDYAISDFVQNLSEPQLCNRSTSHQTISLQDSTNQQKHLPLKPPFVYLTWPSNNIFESVNKQKVVTKGPSVISGLEW